MSFDLLMKDGDDADFVKAVLDSGLGVVTRLPKNCQATHVFQNQSCDQVLPIKLFVETTSQAWNLTDSEYKGVVLLWLTSLSKTLLLHVSTWTTSRTRTSTISSQYSEKLTTLAGCARQLVEASQTFPLHDLQSVLQVTKYKVVGREETLLRPSTNLLEADAHEEIKSILGDNFVETPEKCRADGAYHRGNMELSLGTQTKTCTFKKDGKRLNIFHNTAGYDGILLMCRPMTRVYLGTLLIPSALAPKDLHLCLSENTKYIPYLVSDPELANFMAKLYAAVVLGATSCQWPSGNTVDISSLTLGPFAKLRQPRCVTDQKERDNSDWRQLILPNITYEMPRVQGTTVDVIMNDVRVQDKPAYISHDHNGFPVSVHKNAGRHLTSSRPYSVGDFDALFVFIPGCKQFFLIPATALADQGVLQDDKHNGKTAIVCYPSEYKFQGIGRPPNLWTREYCFDVKDSQLQDKVTQLLADIRSGA